MIQNCKFCKERDLCEVVPGLAVDLDAAIESGVVLDTGVVEQYNEIQDPNSVVTRVKDVFHAMDLQKAYLSAGRITQGSTVGSGENVGVSVSAGAATSSSGSATAGE